VVVAAVAVGDRARRGERPAADVGAVEDLAEGGALAEGERAGGDRRDGRREDVPVVDLAVGRGADRDRSDRDGQVGADEGERVVGAQAEAALADRPAADVLAGGPDEAAAERVTADD